MKKIIYFVLVSFLFNCRKSTPTDAAGANNIALDSSGIKDKRKATFQDLVALLGKDSENPQPIPISWIKDITHFDDSLITPSSKFEGRWIIEDTTGINIAYLDQYDSNYQRKFFLTFKEGKHIDSKEFIVNCIDCSSTDLFCDVKFSNESKRITIVVIYFDPVYSQAMPLESQVNVRKREKWIVDNYGKFVLKE